MYHREFAGLNSKKQLAGASFPLMWSHNDDVNKFLFELMV